MMAPEALAEVAASRASAALTKRRVRKERFSIGGWPFQLIAPEDRPGEWLGRAFPVLDHHEKQNSADCHQLTAWDGTGREALPPWEPNDLVPLGVLERFSNEAIRCAVDIPTDSLIVCNFAQDWSLTCYPSIHDLPAWAKASPFRIILSWLCNRQGMQIVHGAAVALEGHAVLLAGPGGAGKSTTALACALAGLAYLGDDYCAIEPRTGQVHMVYRTAKLFKSSLDLIPSLFALIDNRDKIDMEKGVIFLRGDEVSLARSAKLSAILLPRVGNGSATTLYPATRADAVKAILPSTVGGLMGGTSVTPRLIMELVHSVPSFHLALGKDLKSVVDTVASLVAVPHA